MYFLVSEKFGVDWWFFLMVVFLHESVFQSMFFENGWLLAACRFVLFLGSVWLVRAFHVQFYLLVKSWKFIGDRSWIYQSQKPAFFFCIYWPNTTIENHQIRRIYRWKFEDNFCSASATPEHLGRIGCKIPWDVAWRCNKFHMEQVGVEPEVDDLFFHDKLVL